MELGSSPRRPQHSNCRWAAFCVCAARVLFPVLQLLEVSPTAFSSFAIFIIQWPRLQRSLCLLSVSSSRLKGELLPLWGHACRGWQELRRDVEALSEPYCPHERKRKAIASVFWTQRQHLPCGRRASAVLAPLPGLSAAPGDTPQGLLGAFWESFPDTPGVFHFFLVSGLYSVLGLLLGWLEHSSFSTPTHSRYPLQIILRMTPNNFLCLALGSRYSVALNSQQLFAAPVKSILHCCRKPPAPGFSASRASAPFLHSSPTYLCWICPPSCFSPVPVPQ